MEKILFFSNNYSKTKEVKNLFKNLQIEILCPSDLNLADEPKETGKTFEENAKLKSKFGFSKTKIPCFSDDSGLCIEALNWKPGVFSKRFLNSYKSYKNCFEYIISKVNKTNKNRAYFQTSICYTTSERHHIVFNGKIYGRISSKVLGEEGFGYDPIFIPNNSSKTFGQFNSNEKNLISHRYIAVNKLINFLFN